MNRGLTAATLGEGSSYPDYGPLVRPAGADVEVLEAGEVLWFRGRLEDSRSTLRSAVGRVFSPGPGCRPGVGASSPLGGAGDGLAASGPQRGQAAEAGGKAGGSRG